MSTWANLGLQDRASPLIEQLIFSWSCIINFSNNYSIGGIFNIYIIFNNYVNRFLLHGQLIEIIWTILPAIILLFIALPSLRLLYLLDEINEPSVTLKESAINDIEVTNIQILIILNLIHI